MLRFSSVVALLACLAIASAASNSLLIALKHDGGKLSELQRLSLDVADPMRRSPLFGSQLSREELAAFTRVDSARVEAVRDWLQARGVATSAIELLSSGDALRVSKLPAELAATLRENPALVNFPELSAHVDMMRVVSARPEVAFLQLHLTWDVLSTNQQLGAGVADTRLRFDRSSGSVQGETESGAFSTQWPRWNRERGAVRVNSSFVLDPNADGSPVQQKIAYGA